MAIPIPLDTPFGVYETKIENVESYPLSGGTNISCAEYASERSDRALTFIEHSNGDCEFVEIHTDIYCARIHAKQITASYHGLEGGRINA